MERMKINLDTLVSGAIHSHNYIRVDGKQASNAKYVREAEKQRGGYTSPRNIRKLFIKYTGVDIVYYRPVVGKGDALCESIKFAEDDRKALIAYLNQSQAEMFGGQGHVEELQVSLTGTGFASFLNDLSLSNLEELYFDWTLLLGDKQLLSQYLQVNSAVKTGSVLGLELGERVRYTEINSTKQVKEKVVQAKNLSTGKWEVNAKVMAQTLFNYLSHEMCSTGSMIQKYSRLKYIGFIANSKMTLKSEGVLTKTELINYEQQAFYNNLTKEQLMQSLGVGELFSFSLFLATNVDLYSAGFRVDTGLYQFDKEVLVKYMKSLEVTPSLTTEAELTKWFIQGCDTKLGLESKLKWAKKLNAGELVGQRKAIDKLGDLTTEVDSGEEIKTEKVTDTLEKLLNVKYRQGSQMAKFTLRGLTLAYNIKTTRDFISGFTTEGKRLYSKLLDEILEEDRLKG